MQTGLGSFASRETPVLKLSSARLSLLQPGCVWRDLPLPALFVQLGQYSTWVPLDGQVNSDPLVQLIRIRASSIERGTPGGTHSTFGDAGRGATQKSHADLSLSRQGGLAYAFGSLGMTGEPLFQHHADRWPCKQDSETACWKRSEKARQPHGVPERYRCMRWVPFSRSKSQGGEKE